jgi:RNase P/RNase MRP subunit POP5
MTACSSPVARLPALLVQRGNVSALLHQTFDNLLSAFSRSHVQRRVFVFVLKVGVCACFKEYCNHVAVALAAGTSRDIMR